VRFDEGVAILAGGSGVCASPFLCLRRRCVGGGF